MKKNTQIFIFLAVFLFSNLSFAEIKVSDGWYRKPVAGGAVTAAYFKITNKGKAADKLLSISSPLAQIHELHNVRMSKKGHEMFHVKSILIPAGETVSLKPAGLHAMLIGLHQEAKHDKPVSFRLVFEKAGTLNLNVQPKNDLK